MLPDERYVRSTLRKQFGQDFKQMDALHNLAVRAVHRAITPIKGMDLLTVLVASGLYVKASKQFRSIQTLCQAGLGTDGYALTRNLFETALALVFVLRNRVTLKRGGVRVGKVDRRPLGSRFRARLYLANVAFEALRTLNDWDRTKGLKRIAQRQINRAKVLQEATRAQKVIGSAWTQRLKDTRNYCGVTLKDLAQTVRLSQAYATLYRSASWSTHATDIEQFVRKLPDSRVSLQLRPSDLLIAETIKGASVTLLMCLSFMNDRLSLRLDARIRRHELRLGVGRPK
jgi:hypothetical protein